MIKTLKLSEKSVSKFKTFKNWKYSTAGDENSIILEQGDGIPIFSDVSNKLCTEQVDSEFKINLKYGKEVKGTFFDKDSKYFDETKEPLNQDGSYQRVVYNSIKHLFYNEYGLSGNLEYDKYYKNPMHMFGSETGKYTSLEYSSDTLSENPELAAERRVIGDSITVLEIPSKTFGEKIKPGSFKITDHSSRYESIEITDDGHTNLTVGASSFNEISEITLSSPTHVIDETFSTSTKLYFDYSDIAFGHSLSSSGEYFVSGSPVLSTSPTDMQTGHAAIYKQRSDTKKFELLKRFYCPFTQNGLSQELQTDNTGFLLSELGDIISTNDVSITDNFGKSVELGWDICAIGSPNSHITGKNNEQPTGHVFVYEKNKGGVDNWGLINIFEGEPDSEFGSSISIHRDYMIIGSPELNDGSGGVYIFKKTKRTKSHPWIKTSNIYESYSWNDILKKYDGFPVQDDSDYLNYLKSRGDIVSMRIKRHRDILDILLKTNEITKKQYYENLTTDDDYSQVYPYNLLYATQSDCPPDAWYKKRYWNKNTHPSVRCKEVDSEKFYTKSVWPGYVTDESTGSYIPNPHHEQNKVNRWASRWKIQNVAGNATPVGIFGEGDCDPMDLESFSGDILNSFGGDSGYPLNTYSESPDSAIGDYTYDLIGMVTPPSDKILKFGEVVKITGDKIYISNPSSPDSRCYSYVRYTNKYGCEAWKHTHTLSEKEITGHSLGDPSLSDEISSVSINYYDSYIEVEICPTTDDYEEWAYKLDGNLIKPDDETPTLLGGIRVKKCTSECNQDSRYSFFSRFNTIGGKPAGQIPANYGSHVDISNLFTDDEVDSKSPPVFYSKPELGDSFYTPNPNESDSIALTWKNFRENISFVYPNVNSGTQPSFMTIYSNDAKLDTGGYDPKYILAEIGAQETLNGETVRLILNSGLGESEFYHDFIFKGTPEGTHFILNELKDREVYPCTLPPNQGSYVSIADEDFDDFLENKRNAKFFSRGQNNQFYTEPWSDENSMSLSWKNFRENVSFSYLNVTNGEHSSVMTIYSNEAKQEDGSYDPLCTLAEIEAQNTLNGTPVKLTFNVGSVGGKEFYYEFLFRGSSEGTHYTLNELKDEWILPCTLPPNQGSYVSIADEDFDDFLENKRNAKFFSKEENKAPYTEPWLDGVIDISWKNFRENVSFSYPYVTTGKISSRMTIYSNEAKQEDGSYDPLCTLAEIEAQDTLNGEMVRLTLNTGSVGGDEVYYDFIFMGSPISTHCTLNELKTKWDSSFAELPANQGAIRKITNIAPDDIYKACRHPKFYSKRENQFSYVDPWSGDDAIGLSWKNFRENVSFAYTKVSAGSMPSFMTIYSNEAKQEDGSYDPIYILGEIGAQETLNGQVVRLILNVDNCETDKHTYYEFLFDGSPEGTHFTLDELRNKDNQPPKPTYQRLIRPQKTELIIPMFSENLTKIKSFGTITHNTGNVAEIQEELTDDFLNNKSDAKLYSGISRHQEASGLPNEISLEWKNFREGVSFTYPSIVTGSSECSMTIYADNALDSDGVYNELYILAEINAYETLVGQVVRLTFNTDTDDEYYYEFIYDGTPTGTHYTLTELETKISEKLTKPLSVYSPDRKNCKVRIDRTQISTGFHKLYLALVDSDKLPVGHQSVVEFYNNPTPHDLVSRHLSVKKSYKYSYDVNSEFGRSIDASDNYLIVGNPSDRSFSPINNQRDSYEAGAAYVFSTPTHSDITLMDKLYGEDESEHMFSFRFGNSVSILGENFIVSGHNAECSNVNLVQSGDHTRVEIDDFIHGVEKFSENEFVTTEALITDYEYDLNSEYGDAVLKINIDTLDIDKTKLADIEVKADFIDSGENTIRIDDIDDPRTASANGVYVLRKNPISIQSGCEIKTNDKLKLFVNNNNWSIYWDNIRDRWILTDTPAITTEYVVPDYWKQIFEEFEYTNGIDEFDLITSQNIKHIANIYKINSSEFVDKWSSRITEHDVYSTETTYLDLIILLEAKFELNITASTIHTIFDIYRSHSLKRIDPEIEARWVRNVLGIDNILPLVTELNSLEPVFINFGILKRTLEDVYKVKDGILMSWFVDFGYLYLTRDMLGEIRPGFYDKLTPLNLNTILRVGGVTDIDFINKWRSRLDSGFLVSDVYKDMEKIGDINFSISPQTSPLDLPSEFIYGVGSLDDKIISVSSDNDTIGEKEFLTWGVYRDKTKIVGSRVFVYVNVLPGVEFSDSVVFIYNSVKNAINGFAYYYNISDGKCNNLRKIKTNKNKYEARKQYGHSVSLSSNFIYVGSPVLGNFNVDELITFGGQSVVSFGNTSKLFVEHEDIHPNYLRKLENSIAGSVVIYDHLAVLDTKRYYLGNIFYKNGIVSLTNPSGHFSNILNNSGTNGFEVEFKSTQTLYENEILCRVEPNEFNVSTNPTSLTRGIIEFDIDENGKFDINDLTYIFRYIMGSFVVDEKDPRIEQEEISGMAVGENSPNWPTTDVVLTENEDVLLMDLLMNTSTDGDFDKEYILNKLRTLYDDGVFDIDGDGETTSTDARLLLRYFMGREGSSLTRGLVDGFGNATRFKPKEIISYLDEKTGKNIGRKILEDFTNYKENDQKDNIGSYLAPYATTIGLYSGLDLVMIAKLGKPVKILPNYPINFLIKFDS